MRQFQHPAFDIAYPCIHYEVCRVVINDTGFVSAQGLVHVCTYWWTPFYIVHMQFYPCKKLVII